MVQSFPSIDRCKVVIAGDVMLDKYWYGSVERISPEAPVPVIAVTNAESRPGGAANVATNVGTLGATAILYGIVGEDAAAGELSGLLERANIDARLLVDSEFSTTEKLRLVARNQQLLRADFERKPASGLADSLATAITTDLDDTSVVVISDYAKGSLARPRDIIQVARRQSIPTIVDPKGGDFERYRGATYLTPNAGELQNVVGSWRNEEHLQEKAVKMIQDLDIDALVMTRSEQGISLFRSDGRAVHSPARAREVFDVTGAGDTVVAVLAVTLETVHVDEDRLALANAAASVVVARQGTQSVTASEITDAIKRSGA